MKEINANEFDNVFDKIGKEWALLSAFDETKKEGLCYNTMTVSWGGLGVLWNKNVFFCFVRPQRYTKEFIDKTQTVSLSFFDEKYRDSLVICGKESGRDGDKIKKANLNVKIHENTVVFDEAKYTLVGRKLYEGDILESGFVDKSIIDACYPSKDYHTMYVCEIVKLLEN